MTRHSDQAPADLPDISLDDALAWLIPRGFPTLDEFMKNPDKYRTRPEEILESVDRSTDVFRSRVKGQHYFWRDDIDCGKKLEMVERICKLEGYDLLDLEMQPVVKRINGTSEDGPVEIEVHFWPKGEFHAMGGIIANAR